MPPMSPSQEITNGLWWREDSNRAVLMVGDDGDLHPLVELIFDPERTRCLLVMLGGRRRLDVTVQPGAVARVVAAEALRSAHDGNGWCGAVEAAVAAAAAQRNRWQRSPQAPPGLVALLGGLGYPLLAGAYDRGVQPISEIPRWGAHVLAEPSARGAATAAFGERATRRNARALAQSLLPPEGAPAHAAVALAPLCLGLAGRVTLDPDSIAEVLFATAHWHPPPAWLSSGQLTDAARLLSLFGAAAATRLLLAAATRPHGPELLFDTLLLYRHVRHHLSGAPPGDLDELRRVCIELSPTPPPPPLEAAPVTRRNHARRAPARRRDEPHLPAAHDVPLHAPRVAAARLPASFAYPAAIRALEQVADRDIVLRLPHSPAELSRWGDRLRNCLATFSHAVAEGASWIVGIEHRGRLTACVEVDPRSRTVRQFLAVGNRAPSNEIVEPTLRILAVRRIIRDEART